MKEIQQPKKQPEIIRKRISEQAIILASQKGISGVSIQNVATGAGISKGGVFHHFANKQILIEAMISEVLFHLDRKVEDFIENDPIEYGKFTRAYILIAFMSPIDELVSLWSALAMTMITDATSNIFFKQWLQTKLEKYQSTDSSIELELIRLATDGLWIQRITEVIDHESSLKYKNILLKKTYLT